jgi:hypothetical protein
MRIITPKYIMSSLDDKSTGKVFNKCFDDPNNAFTHDLKNIVGANKYKNTTKKTVNNGYKSKKNEKNKISATNIIDPGKPKNTKRFNKLIRKSLGHIKLIPLISVIKRVLKRRPIPSTSKKEFVDKSAWLISIQKLASIKDD